jgi:hypothetical protein
MADQIFQNLNVADFITLNYIFEKHRTDIALKQLDTKILIQILCFRKAANIDIISYSFA